MACLKLKFQMEVHIVLRALSPPVPAHDTIMMLCSFLLQKALILYELLVCVLPPTLKEEAVPVVKQNILIYICTLGRPIISDPA